MPVVGLQGETNRDIDEYAIPRCDRHSSILTWTVAVLCANSVIATEPVNQHAHVPIILVILELSHEESQAPSGVRPSLSPEISQALLLVGNNWWCSAQSSASRCSVQDRGHHRERPSHHHTTLPSLHEHLIQGFGLGHHALQALVAQTTETGFLLREFGEVQSASVPAMIFRPPPHGPPQQLVPDCHRGDRQESVARTCS